MSVSYSRSLSSLGPVNARRPSPTPLLPGTTSRLEQVKDSAVYALQQFRLRNESLLREFEAIWQAMLTASPFVMARALGDLGCFTRENELLTAESISQRTAFPTKYRALMSQWLHVLAHYGLVKATSQSGAYATAPVDLGRIQQRIDQAFQALPTSTPYPGFIEFFRSCVQRQTALLQGTAHPQKMLFPSGSFALVEGLYRTNPASAAHNTVVAAIVAAARRMFDESRKLRIVEVGAGTGATTAAILARLPHGTFEYVYTDISRFFLKRARNEFSSVPEMSYQVFDIDRSPRDQGIEPCSVDLLVAANALHTARDINRSLRYLREVLGNKGLLVAIETTSNTALQMITFGHFEGVCHFEDDRRRSNLPFLSAHAWQRAMQEAAFEWSAAVPETDASNAWSQHVLLGASNGLQG